MGEWVTQLQATLSSEPLTRKKRQKYCLCSVVVVVGWEDRGIARISGRGVLKIFLLLRLPLMRVHVHEWVGSLLSAALAHAKHCRIAVPTILSAGEERYAVAAY